MDRLRAAEATLTDEVAQIAKAPTVATQRAQCASNLVCIL